MTLSALILKPFKNNQKGITKKYKELKEKSFKE